MFTSCQPHHPFWLGRCWEDLLLSSLAFYLFPYLLFPLKMKLKSPNTHTQWYKHAGTQASHCHTRRLTKQCRAAPRHMKEQKPLVLLLLYLLLILSLHFLTFSPCRHLLFLLCSRRKCKGRQGDPCFVFVLYFVLFCFLLHLQRTDFSPFSICHFPTHSKPPYKVFPPQHLLLLC